MIIGAYVTGLSLSKTDISYTVLESSGAAEGDVCADFFRGGGMMVLRVFADHKSSILLLWR